ncbi:hypothetical protein L3X38_030044 [Prunus dulcis]|uniref:Uncharacterized protein n=1 Tax=Prunus dulcis TaxID=3755 RepID=A0AAD4VVA7_PRUDU|nr:hypothetical protein L3X38_030044 [Prunus dulcis]
MSESSTNSTRSNGYCFCGMKIKRRTSWTDLNPGRRIAKQDIISLNGWIMKHVQEERKCFLDCLEDSELWRKKLEQEMSN